MRAIAAGAYHTLLATTSGQLWSVGANSHGQLARPVAPFLPSDATPQRVTLPTLTMTLSVAPFLPVTRRRNRCGRGGFASPHAASLHPHARTLTPAPLACTLGLHKQQAPPPLSTRPTLTLTLTLTHSRTRYASPLSTRATR